jgi:hypothetical protein
MNCLTPAFLLAFASTAFADEVVLRNGHKVVGIQTEENDRIVVETGYGKVTYPRDQVVSVTKGETPMHAWPVRYAEVEKSTNAADFTKLAAWAKENGMPRYVGSLMKRALELDPDNADARAELGYVRHQGRWLTQEEFRKQQGQVQDRGRWVLPLEKELQERRRLESESKRLDRESRRRERDEEKRRAREEVRMQAQIAAAAAAPTAYDPYWGRGAYSSYGYPGYWYGDVYDLIMVDWLLSFTGSGGVFPLSRVGAPRIPGAAPGLDMPASSFPSPVFP